MALIRDLIKTKQCEIVGDFSLTPRQRELFLKLTDLSYRTNREIAYELGIKSNTLRFMTSQLREKLNLPNNDSILKKLITQITDNDLRSLVGFKNEPSTKE